jgi:hypothetical protein
MLDRVYRAFAWQRVDQIRYNMFKKTEKSLNFDKNDILGGTKSYIRNVDIVIAYVIPKLCLFYS